MTQRVEDGGKRGGRGGRERRRKLTFLVVAKVKR